MSHFASKLLATAIVTIACGAGQAQAQDGFIDEVRMGVFDHDTGVVGSSKEDGVDFNAEILSHPVSALHIIGEPRVVAGIMLNNSDQTNQVYLGLVAQRDFAHGVFQPDDAFFIEGVVSGTYHDGKIDVTGTPADADWKSHGSHLLFRTGFALGYRFNETWSLEASFNHISNANFAQPNQGANDLGLRIGRKF